MDYRQLYTKLVDGDTLRYKELEALYDHLAAAGRMLDQLGPVFSLSAVELNRRSEQVRGYIEARKGAYNEARKLPKKKRDAILASYNRNMDIHQLCSMHGVNWDVVQTIRRGDV